MCSWSQVDVLQQCRQNTRLLWSDCFQEKKVYPTSQHMIYRKYSWPLVLLRCPEMGEDMTRMQCGNTSTKRNVSSAIFQLFFCFGSVLADPSAFYPRIHFYQLMAWQFNSIRCATYEHNQDRTITVLNTRLPTKSTDLWLHECNVSKWWIKITTYQGTLYTLIFLYLIYFSLPTNPHSLLDFHHSTVYTPAEPCLIEKMFHLLRWWEPLGWFLKAAV